MEKITSCLYHTSKEEKKLFKAFAKAFGLSLSGFTRMLFNEKMERHPEIVERVKSKLKLKP